jgi:hypothetical protein
MIVLAQEIHLKMHNPRYSLDLALCDFSLVPKLKNTPKGQQFADSPDILHNVIKLLRSIREDDF